MKLSKLALLAIKGCDGESKKRMMAVLGVAYTTFLKYLSENDDNLTKAAALKVIREETGLRDDQLMDVEAEAAKI